MVHVYEGNQQLTFTISTVNLTWMSRWKLGSKIRISGFITPIYAIYTWLITHLLTIDPTVTSWDILVGRVQPIHIEEYSADSGDENPLSMGPTIVSTMWPLKTILLQGRNGTPINGRKSMGFIGL